MNFKIINSTLAILILLLNNCLGQTAMINVAGRNKLSLNGNWQVIIDPLDAGEWRQVWQEKKPATKTDFTEYSFEGGPFLKVPGDFNSQLKELNFYEGVVWYKKQFQQSKKQGKRYFLYFGAVNYKADVFLNGKKLGSHEGGFTPFQFEVTSLLKESSNTVIVKADNRRMANGIPGYGYDWFNYGGITRDVALVETEETFISDYFIQLKKGSRDTVSGWIKLDGTSAMQNIRLKIPEINFNGELNTNRQGYAEVNFKANLKLWSPQHPKRYRVVIENGNELLIDTIGFRSIEVNGTDVLLNGQKIFLKSVNIHEENPFEKRRCTNENDAHLLLSAAKELGCNMVRLVHYPHNEYTIRQAEKMGLMVWSEIPVYQHINFSDSTVPGKIQTMQQEMVARDRNRCAVIIWSLSNETYPGTPGRNAALISATKNCREMDNTRLIVHVANTQSYSNNVFNVWDTIYHYSDLVAVNEYIGWYLPWQGHPGETKWTTRFSGKPVFIAEFGGEALYGHKIGNARDTLPWTEGYQKEIYKNQIQMFDNIPGLCGVCPWLLFDYRSPVRMNQVYQKGYNRKGLLSENGYKKLAWWEVKKFYKSR